MGHFDHLPPAIRTLLPEIETLDWPAETHADCSRCPMADGRFGPWGFTAETRCCTAQPSLANFLVGRALGRGEPGRARILARMADSGGVSAWGIDPQPELDRRYRESIATAFGRDGTLRCPYYVGGEHTCGIWHDRSATCRTWFCKHEDGLAGAVAWSRMSLVLFEVESRLAVWAIGQGDAPDDDAPVAVMAAWFERAAAIVDAATAADLAPLATAGLARYRREVGQFVDARLLRRRPMVDVLVPAVTEMVRLGGDVLLTGYSSFDAVRAPAAVFELLARLDGRPWRTALAEARSATGEARLDEALVRELHRVMALRDPAGGDDLPYAVEMADMDRWSRAAEKVPDE